MECKYCGSVRQRKNGYMRGAQRYNCKDCHRNWTIGKGNAYSASMQMQALKLYLEGLGFRSIGRVLGVSNVTVLKWIRNMGRKLFHEMGLGPTFHPTGNMEKDIADIQELYRKILGKNPEKGVI